MARLILIILAITGVWLILRRLAARRPPPPARRERAFQPTVRCRECGAYIDRRLARPDGDGFCCRSHEDVSGQ